MRDLKSAVADLLLQLVNDTIAEGPDRMLSLACELERYADKVRETRGEMLISPVFYCCDCRRAWTITFPQKREDDVRPENCPACYNASGTAEQPRRSVWMDSFKYMEE